MRALALATFALVGCTGAMSSAPTQTAAPGPSPPMAAPHSPLQPVVYACETGDKLTVNFTEGAATVVDSHGRTFHLTQQVTGSGIDYQGAGQELRGKGEEATWSEPGGASVLCSAAHSPLVGTRWELVELRSSDKDIGTITPHDPSKFTMDLMAGGRLAMQLDCNRASGAWDAHPTSPTEGALSLGEPAMTRAMCLMANGLDTKLALQLGRVRTYKLDGERLILTLEGDSGAITWRRSAH